MIHIVFVIAIIVCLASGFPENLDKAQEVNIVVDHVNYSYERREYRLSIAPLTFLRLVQNKITAIFTR